MSVEFIFRIIGMIVFSIAGGYFGAAFSPYTPSHSESVRIIWSSVLIGALAGLILTPYITTRPVRILRSILGRLAAESLFAGLLGLIVGLLTAALLAFPLSLLPKPFGQILPFIGVLLFSYLGV